MKKLLVVLAVLLVSALSARAQSIYPMGVGLHVKAKAGVNTASIPEGRKTFVAFTGLPDIGVSFYAPFSQDNNFGALIELGYGANAFGEKFLARTISGLSVPDILGTYKLKYFSFSPMIAISALTLGVNVGIPMGENVAIDSYTIAGQTQPAKDVEIKSDEMATLIDLRLGVAIPVHNDKNGRLSFILQGSYSLTGVAKNYSDKDVNNKDLDNSYNPKPASLSLGLSYLFSLR